jgi:hypothetical protein
VRVYVNVLAQSLRSSTAFGGVSTGDWVSLTEAIEESPVVARDTGAGMATPPVALAWIAAASAAVGVWVF